MREVFREAAAWTQASTALATIHQSPITIHTAFTDQPTTTVDAPVRAPYIIRVLHSFFHKAGRLLLVVALLVSCGAHWLVLQSIAWTAMLVENSQRTTLVEAVKRTFDGTHPCGLCKQIAGGKQQEKKSDTPLFAGKIELIYEPHAIALHPPRLEQELPSLMQSAPAYFPPPLLQPPRLS
jgi:hypothetical protein